ncbi:unnamed protein product [Arabidopsis thaliana]|uniref:Uncharacterized protein At5g22530 n=1 Tax=Arabidopsis thaliana TaxID=3702 RepID=Q9FK86_ARATH|nr:uncharacterized protein AT5G22530 [Arabidopsis thaliana]AAK64035.1 unknown protein [Arabidopsis thaliana]AAL85044.1 unknown protein [Arabidopsis thaliana]AED93037.1 hypothetical protein AT5G22530 [Arabidopsis thaliana]BAB09125.1 unnamed protein product [Arabidopsis thaliana]|eukprot:NP_568419.1 hypothetical protein AT5G22530 [Arabidopsis thaliana]
MSTGCLSCFKVMCFKKKQSKKEAKPVKTEILPEPVGEKEDVERKEGIQAKPLRTEGLPEPVEKKKKDVKYSACKKMPEKCMFKPKPEWISHVGSNDVGPKVGDFYGDHYAETDDSSSSMTNEFNKVKTFDIRGVKLATS